MQDERRPGDKRDRRVGGGLGLRSGAVLASRLVRTVCLSYNINHALYILKKCGNYWNGVVPARERRGSWLDDRPGWCARDDGVGSLLRELWPSRSAGVRTYVRVGYSASVVLSEVLFAEAGRRAGLVSRSCTWGLMTSSDVADDQPQSPTSTAIAAEATPATEDDDAALAEPTVQVAPTPELGRWWC